MCKETLVFVLLVMFTFGSWYVSLFSENNASTGSVGGVIVLLFAFFKVRMVVQYFMEVREAVFALKLITDIWIVAVSVILSSIYYF